jgi:hypothetical protein
VTVAGGYAAAWAVLAASITAIGLLLTKAVLSDGHGRWDESINRWLAEHRVDFWNHVTSAATFIANTLPVVVLLQVQLSIFGALPPTGPSTHSTQTLYLVPTRSSTGRARTSPVGLDPVDEQLPRATSRPPSRSVRHGADRNGTVRNRGCGSSRVLAILASVTVAFARRTGACTTPPTSWSVPFSASARWPPRPSPSGRDRGR